MSFACCPRCGQRLALLEGDPLEGSEFADRYLIEVCIGEGGMGRVYRARHQRMSRRFAVKVLFGDFAADPKMQARFAQEAEAASRLQHPNLVSVVDFGETDDGLYYLVMDYASGPSLSRVIAREGPLDPWRVVTLARQMCAGLAHAHKQGLVHRDFKSDNVIIEHDADGQPRARIVDFGIALIAGANSGLTTEGLVVGTPAFMSPEQASAGELDARTDLFSLGVTMYEMLAGVLPFDGSGVEVARLNVTAEPPGIAVRAGVHVDAALEALVMRLMAKRREDRPASAEEVDAALASLALGGIRELTPAPSPAPADTERTAPPVRSRRRLGAVAAVVAVGLAAGVAVIATGGDAAGPRAVSTPAAEASPPASPIEAAPAVAPIDAGVMATAEPPDAALPTVPGTASQAPARPEARPTAAREARRGRARRDREPEQAAPTTPEAPPPTPPSDAVTTPAPAPTVATLTSRYRRVGRALDRLVAQRGEAKTDALRRRYLAIPLTDALRVPGLRAEVDDRLRVLQEEIDAQLEP